MEEFLNSFKKCLKYQTKGMIIANLSNFSGNNPEQHPDDAVI